MTTTTIELLRHGLPEGDDCFRGHTDFKLTAQGFSQMERAMTPIDELNLNDEIARIPNVVISSPLSRCYRFARQFADLHQIPLHQSEAFIELNFGDWDGLSKQQVWEQDQQRLSDFWLKPWDTTPPNGESVSAFDLRIVAAWEQLLQKHQGRHILLVTHGGVIKQILRNVLNMPKDAIYLQRLTIPYAAKIKITIYHDDSGQHWPQLHWPQC